MKKQLAALVIVAAAVAGCGSTTSTGSVGAGGGTTPSAGPTPSGSPDPMQTQHSVGGTVRSLPTAIKPLPRTAKRLSLPWRFLRLTDGGKKVEISLQYGGCTAFSYVQVVQSSSAVQLTAWGSASGDSHAICPAFEAILNGTVTLSAPLGSRQLLHGLVSLNRGIPRQ
jgi:hypothetical protein